MFIEVSTDVVNKSLDSSDVDRDVAIETLRELSLQVLYFHFNTDFQATQLLPRCCISRFRAGYLNSNDSGDRISVTMLPVTNPSVPKGSANAIGYTISPTLSPPASIIYTFVDSVIT